MTAAMARDARGEFISRTTTNLWEIINVFDDCPYLEWFFQNVQLRNVVHPDCNDTWSVDCVQLLHELVDWWGVIDFGVQTLFDASLWVWTVEGFYGWDYEKKKEVIEILYTISEERCVEV